MDEETLSKKQVKLLAEFIYCNLNDYITENYDAFMEFLKNQKEKKK